MAYSKQTWQTGDPITAVRMNKIEGGIEDAHTIAENALTADSPEIDALQTSVSNLSDTVNGTTSTPSLASQISDIRGLIDQQDDNGTWAADQIHHAIGETANHGSYDNLDTRITRIDTKLSQTSITATNANTQVTNAMRNINDSLVQRFLDVERDVSSVAGGLNSLTLTINNSGVGGGTLAQRLQAIDDNSTPTRHLPDVIRELTDAHGANNVHGELNDRFNTIENEIKGAHTSTALASNGVNKAYDSLDARFEAIEAELVGATDMETRIDTIAGNVNDVANNKVNKTDIANNLTTTTTGKVLDATQGKILKDAIDNLDDAYKAADTALDGRLDAIDGGSALDTTNGTLAARVAAVEAVAGDAAVASTVNQALSDLDGRLDAIDSGSNTTISGIIGRLDDLDNSTDGRVKAAEDAIDALETAIGDSNSGLVKDIADNASAISDINTAIDHAASGNDPGGLTQRITALETTPKSATVIIAKERIVYDNEGVPTVYENNYVEGGTNTAITPSVDVDYLFETEVDSETKYFYWKYIDNNWELISGGIDGGTGSSSGIILSELPSVSVGDPNIDYFIGDNNVGYIHYRFIKSQTPGANGTYVKILPIGIINDIEVGEVSIENAAEADKWPTTQSFSGGLEAYALEDTEKENNLLADFVAVRNARIQAIYDEHDELQSQKLQILDTNGKLMEYPIVGGGGTSNLYTGHIESSTAANQSIPSNSSEPITISGKVIIQQGQTVLPNATAEGVIQYRRKGTTTWNTGNQIEVVADTEDAKYTINNNTVFTVDVTKYLVEDITMEFRFVLTAYPASEEDAFAVYSSIFRVTKVNISITDEEFDYASVKNGNFQFNYRCFGSDITKTVHFLLDNEDVVTPVTTTTHNTILQQIIPIAKQEDGTPVYANGMHTFQVYFVTSTGLRSNTLNYYILYNTDNTREAPLIGAAAEKTSIIDGDELIVNYSVSTVGTEKTDSVVIELYKLENNNEVVLSTTTLTDVTNNKLADPPYRTFDYPRLEKASPTDPDPDPITVYVRLTATHNGLSDSQTVAVEIRYLETKYTLSPEGTLNLVYEYNAYGRSNNNVDKETYVYPYHTVSGKTINFNTIFNNFNWATDGYVDGESLTVGGGATVNINVPIFNSKYNRISIEENENIEKITTNGRTIEIDYEVLSTTNMGATIIDCMTTGANPKGFRITPQNCYLLNSGSKIDIDETGFIENEENVAAAYLNPGTRTHLTFVIEPISTSLAADNTYHQSANIYVNGEFANSCPYNTVGNDFDNNATITIGSDTCLIKIYSIKLYNRGLTSAQVLHNYEVAPIATRNKLQRLEDNDVLDRLGHVDYEKARKKYTCLLLTGMGTVNGIAVPTMAPYKGYPSVVGRQKDGETVGKTESGLLLTKPTTANSNGYSVEFDLQDKLIDPNNLYGYASSNNVQGTSSQKFPVKNLKVYLAKGDDSNIMVFDENETISTKQIYKYSINTAAAAAYTSVHGSEASLPDYIKDCGANIATIVKNLEEVPTQAEVVDKIIEYLNDEDTDVGAAYSTYSTGDELIVHPIKAYKKSKKVKYALRENGIGESTLCWKADYMSTDHANTFNANIANTLYNVEDRLSDRWTDQTQFTVYGIKCLLFQQNGDGQPEFVGDGCLNNDKGNHATFGLETPGDEDDNTMCQKWDFRNNTGSLLYFKHDGLFETIDGKPAVARELECIYPDEGDLTDIGITPNYNHFQILSSWLGNRANYWYESDPAKKAAKKQIFIDEFTNHFNYNHILIYYLFMEYTALCDNRVKNIHMRTDNAGEERIKIKNSDAYYFEGNENPNSGPWTLAENLETHIMQEPIMDENGDYQFDGNGNMELGDVSHVFVNDTVIDSIDWEQGEGHSNFAIWAPVLYDLDSCFSADNVGYLKIRYDADWDYSLYNKLKFAGFDSILWLQVEDCFQDDLKIMAKRLYNRVIGLNYSTFYRQQITDNLASVCPAITNQDMILKYDKPWTEGFLDYSQDVLNPSISTDKYKYLQRGTRTGQKAIFMKQRSLFLASKYDGNEFIQDKITFRAGTQVNHENSVLTLTANQKLYHGAQFGDVNDTTKVTRRASKIYDSTLEKWVDINEEGWIPEFTPCQIQHSGNMNNTDGIEIYGASVLNDIGDISRFHPWQVKVGSAVNLKKLIIGSTTPGYSNTSTDEIDGLNACVLLEEINVCNLKNLTSLQLNNNGFIKKVYATGSGLNTLALPRGGVLDTIAYGANTTDITIINQSRLTNFSYEDSANNNYANVTRLWIENTPNVPVKDIITARLTPSNSNDEGLRAGGLRVIGIDLNLGSDSAFLQLLVSDLAKGTYLTAQGGHIENETDYPTITGTIRITQIRRSLYNKLHEIYPDLEIVTANIVEEHTVEYYNNGTLIYTDHGTDEDYVKDPAYDTDPITNLPYLAAIYPPDGIPTKPADAQYKYKFGLYTSQGKYRRFTGWVKRGTSTNPTSNDTIENDIVLDAVYPTTEDQYYRVSWYQEINGELQSYKDVKYGSDLSSEPSPIDLGTMSRIRTGSNSVKVFKGWSCPLGKITSNVNVYGLWEESTINDQTENITLSTLNAADIYAVSRLSSSRKQQILADKLGTPIMIPLGQEYDYPEGVNITNLLGHEPNIILDGDFEAIRVYDNITPLSGNGDWTLALDYKFLMDARSSFYNGEYVLASCYKNVNNGPIVGFKVSLVRNTPASPSDIISHAIQVSWGTQSLTIDYATTDTSEDWVFKSYRNVVVLSHNSNSPNILRVSYTIPSNSGTPGTSYGTTLTNAILEWDSNATTTNPLIIGGNYSGATTNIEDSDTGRCPAQGIIYWAKYWDTDLGEINCSNLAAWPHETVPFLLTGYNGASKRTSEQIYSNSSLSFAAAQGVGDRIFYAGGGATDSNGIFGWHQSAMRALCNNVIYNGLPEAYRAIVSSQTIKSLKRYCGEGTQYNTWEPNTQDYLFLSARREIDDSMSPDSHTESLEVETTWDGPWGYLANKKEIYQLWGTSNKVVEPVQSSSTAYHLYRFDGTYISENAHIFKLANRPTTINGLQIKTPTGNIDYTIQSGDVWINNSNVAFIYRSEDDIINGETVDIRESSGGWKQAKEWALRTYNPTAGSATEWHFMRVAIDGTIETSPVSSNSRNTPRLICPEFTVR